MEIPQSRRKFEKPHPEWKEGDRMPLEPLPVDEIVGLSTADLYQRLIDSHNISPEQIWKRKPTGQKWSEQRVLQFILARLEGHSDTTILFELQETDEKYRGLTPSVLTGIATAYCNDSVYQKMRNNSEIYNTNLYKSREFPADRLAAILKTLGLEREELFGTERRFAGRYGGIISIYEMLRFIELRLGGRSREESVRQIATEGNVDLDRMEPEPANRLLEASLIHYLSKKARDAYKLALDKRRGR
jgi:hypothetical protein